MMQTFCLVLINAPTVSLPLYELKHPPAKRAPALRVLFLVIGLMSSIPLSHAWFLWRSRRKSMLHQPLIDIYTSSPSYDPHLGQNSALVLYTTLPIYLGTPLSLLTMLFRQ